LRTIRAVLMFGEVSALPWFVFLPGAAFALVWALERIAPATDDPPRRHDRADWTLNLIGLAAQGALVPLVGLWVTTQILAPAFPAAAGALPIGFWGGFALNVLAIDFLYYWQHRAFHARIAWPLHIAHHASQRVDVWATSRNTVWTNFLFVYFMINPWAALLCDAPEGFYTGAAVTAALDLWRHGRVDYGRLGLSRVFGALSLVMITPPAHQRHHDAIRASANFGANFSAWDRLFGTYAEPASQNESRAAYAPSALRQLLWPWRARGGEGKMGTRAAP